MARLRRAATLALLWSGEACACSGPAGADAIIRRNVLHAHLFWAYTLALAAVLFLLKPRHYPGVVSLATLSVLNPVFLVNPLAGDCGTGMEGGAVLFAALATGVAAWSLLARRKAQRARSRLHLP